MAEKKTGKKETVEQAAVMQAAVQKGTVQTDTVEKGTVQKGTVQKGTVQKGTIQKGTVQKGTIQKGTVEKGTWVEIYFVLLAPGERAPQIPEDTRQVPLEVRVKGTLQETAALGDERVEIVTASGRHLRGKLAAVNPAYTHSFGPPVPELTPIGAELRALLCQRGYVA